MTAQTQPKDIKFDYVDKTIGRHVTWLPIIKKSAAGVEYIHYKKITPPFPKGDNRAARRRVVALARKPYRENKCICHRCVPIKPNAHSKTKESR